MDFKKALQKPKSKSPTQAQLKKLWVAHKKENDMDTLAENWVSFVDDLYYKHYNEETEKWDDVKYDLTIKNQKNPFGDKTGSAGAREWLDIKIQVPVYKAELQKKREKIQSKNEADKQSEKDEIDKRKKEGMELTKELDRMEEEQARAEEAGAGAGAGAGGKTLSKNKEQKVRKAYNIALRDNSDVFPADKSNVINMEKAVKAFIEKSPAEAELLLEADMIYQPNKDGSQSVLQKRAEDFTRLVRSKSDEGVGSGGKTKTSSLKVEEFEEEEQKEEVRPEEEGKEDEEEDDDDDFEDIDDEMSEEVFANMDASVIANMSVKSAMKAVEDAQKALNLAQNKVANDKASSVKADATAPYEAPPSKSDLIPPARLSTRYKEVDELNDDINYFITNFKDVLTNEEKIYGKMNKKDKKMLTRLHNKITGKIGTSSKSGKSENNILIGVDADTYIEERVKKIMKENTFNNLRSEDAVIPVEEDMRVKDTKNFGGYEVKRSPDGGLSSQKEGQYRNAPTTQPEEPERKKRTSGLKILNNTQRNRAKTAQRMVRNNPFLTKDKGFDLMYLY